MQFTGVVYSRSEEYDHYGYNDGHADKHSHYGDTNHKLIRTRLGVCCLKRGLLSSANQLVVFIVVADLKKTIENLTENVKCANAGPGKKMCRCQGVHSQIPNEFDVNLCRLKENNTYAILVSSLCQIE